MSNAVNYFVIYVCIMVLLCRLRLYRPLHRSDMLFLPFKCIMFHNRICQKNTCRGSELAGKQCCYITHKHQICAKPCCLHKNQKKKIMMMARPLPCYPFCDECSCGAPADPVERKTSCSLLPNTRTVVLQYEYEHVWRGSKTPRRP